MMLTTGYVVHLNYPIASIEIVIQLVTKLTSIKPYYKLIILL